MSVRIQAADLRDAARKSSAIRAEAAERGAQRPEILLDVEVTIDRDAASALRVWDSRSERDSALRYVGTPRGLAGLISDVRRLDIADGVVLVTPAKDQVLNLMLDELVPGLPA
jgi:alkanesulfonate monooxygenase SsuD/methylene tetrahydromethanopterin reductase-like flavin-dependent oxidoreductase (luciferase family)